MATLLSVEVKVIQITTSKSNTDRAINGQEIGGHSTTTTKELAGDYGGALGAALSSKPKPCLANERLAVEVDMIKSMAIVLTKMLHPSECTPVSFGIGAGTTSACLEIEIMVYYRKRKLDIRKPAPNGNSATLIRICNAIVFEMNLVGTDFDAENRPFCIAIAGEKAGGIISVERANFLRLKINNAVQAY